MVPNDPVLHVASLAGLAMPLLHALPEIASTTGAVLGAAYYALLILDRYRKDKRDGNR